MIPVDLLSDARLKMIEELEARGAKGWTMNAIPLLQLKAHTTLMDFVPIDKRPTRKIVSMPYDETRLLLARLSDACTWRGGALYGTLSELQAACGVSFQASDLDTLYERHAISLSHDQAADWYFVQIEGEVCP